MLLFRPFACCLLAVAAGCATDALAQDLPVIRPGKPQTTNESTPIVAGPREETEVEEHWQMILVGDERIGYSRTRMESIPPDGGTPRRLRVDTETKMTFKRFGQTLSIGVDLATVETPSGELLSFEYEMGTSPTSTTKSVGRIDGKQLHLETTIAGATQTKTLPWDPTVKSPAYQERLLREEGLRPGETKTFRAFVPEFNKVTEIKIAALEPRDVKLPNGKYRSLLKAKVTQSILPTMSMTAYLDDAGELVLVESDLLGQTMRTYEVPKAEALRELSGAELDLAVNSLVPATPLDNPHDTRRIVYRVHTPGENASSLFIKSDTQQVKKIDRETVEITVTAKPVPKSSGRVEAAEEYTKPTQLLQSDDRRIRDHLQRAVSVDRSDSEAALALEKYVHEKLDTKNFTTAFASAAEVAEKLEGDCSEHAVLLAALLRARDIPSRIVVGLVYVPGQASMGGHMWTEALLGNGWVPLDATLGRGGIGAAHLKVAESSLADDAPLPITSFVPLLSLGSETKIDVLKVDR